MGISLVENIIGAMRAEIAKYGLEVLQRYPDDLLVHDRRTLESCAVPGAVIAWMTGHSHTHLVRIGIHPEENRGVTYLTNLASEDRFYVIRVANTGTSFTMGEITRSDFEALAKTQVAYKRQGDRTGFWLSREGRRVGSIMLRDVGTHHVPRFSVTLTPVCGASALDKAALRLWGERAAIEEAHTLFVRFTIEEAPAISLPDAA